VGADLSEEQKAADVVASNINDVSEPIAELISQLPQLEPICGLALAFNLAYLNLKMFRYRETLAKFARKKVKGLGGNDPDGHKAFAGFPWYWNACILANHESYPCPPGKSATDNMKGTPWHISLTRWFDKGLDVKLTVAASLFSGGVLILGVAHSIGWFPITNFLGSGSWLAFLFVLLVASMIAPTFFVWRGQFVVKRGKSYLRDTVQEEAETQSGNIGQTLGQQQTAVNAAQAQPQPTTQ